ncbi:MAG: D-alanine--D-alanine ligase [Candidatus Omnitrophica bacterium]|nr:D-alanine--D-alanine ligase [Candidatus Omnitrophota bacterium]
MKSLTEKEREVLSDLRRSKTIGVLMGGSSSERDISLKSGAAVLTHLSEGGYRVEPCAFDREEELPVQLKKKRIQLAFLALHGKFGEDGTVQALLESLKISYTGSDVLASRRAIDKWAAKETFRKKGLLTPVSWMVKPSDPIPSSGFSFPIVVKPVCQGSSIGLSIVDRPEELPEAVKKAFQFDARVLLEEYIRGSELTVGILGEEALPVIQILPGNRCYDYEAKYTSDKTQFLIPAPIDDGTTCSVQEAALQAHEALGCSSFSRVDLLLNEEGQPVILEVNTIPGMTARSLLPKACEAAGISFLELCERLLLMALFKTKTQGIHAEKKSQ